jgi:hypothetical protein
MKNYKNYLIALLTGLLVLSLTIEPSQGATAVKTYDAVKLIQYDRCLDFTIAEGVSADRFGGNISIFMPQIINACFLYKP